jgi:hypothetical protein
VAEDTDINMKMMQMILIEHLQIPEKNVTFVNDGELAY